MIPLHIQAIAKLISIPKWEYGKNLAKGEITKFNYVESQRNQHKFNDQVVGSEDGFDMIWRHIADDWFKLIGKSPEQTC